MARIKDENIRVNVKATESPRKSKERRLLWYGHIRRGDDDYVERWVMDLMVDGTINREKPKNRWMNNLPEEEKVRRKWCVGQNKVERKVCQKHRPRVNATRWGRRRRTATCAWHKIIGLDAYIKYSRLLLHKIFHLTPVSGNTQRKTGKEGNKNNDRKFQCRWHHCFCHCLNFRISRCISCIHFFYKTFI